MTPIPGKLDESALRSLLVEYRQALVEMTRLAGELAVRTQTLEDTLAAHDVTPPESFRGRHIGDKVIELKCFGRFEARIDGVPLVLPPGGRAAAVLKAFAHNRGHPMSRDELAESLWPSTPTNVGANRLRVAIHGLRRLAGADREIVSFDGGLYRLSADRVEIDVDRFEAYLASATDLEGKSAPEQAVRQLDAACSLYAGHYFEDESADERYMVRREHLRDVYLNLMVRLATLAFEQGEIARCMSLSHAIIRLDVCSESAYRLLMLAHEARGERARALRWFEVCEEALERELGVGPSPSMRLLQAAVRGRDGVDHTPATQQVLNLRSRIAGL